jgi:hypothetical protein
MEGCIKAGKMVDCTMPDGSDLPTLGQSAGNEQQQQISGSNTMNGSIKPLETISQYKVPCFTNELAIIDWKEE